MRGRGGLLSGHALGGGWQETVRRGVPDLATAFVLGVRSRSGSPPPPVLGFPEVASISWRGVIKPEWVVGWRSLLSVSPASCPALGPPWGRCLRFAVTAGAVGCLALMSSRCVTVGRRRVDDNSRSFVVLVIRAPEPAALRDLVARGSFARDFPHREAVADQGTPGVFNLGVASLPGGLASCMWRCIDPKSGGVSQARVLGLADGDPLVHSSRSSVRCSTRSGARAVPAVPLTIGLKGGIHGRAGTRSYDVA